MNILYEDNALVVLDKPAGLSSEEGEMNQIRRKFAEQDAAFPAAAFEVGGQRVIEIARVRVVGSAEARKGVVLFMENRQRG